MPFEKRHIWGKHENKGKCENTIYFPHMMVHTNFEKTFKRIILTGIFIPGVLLKRSDLYFKYFDAIWTYNIKNQNFKKEKIITISILNEPNLMRNRIIIHMLVLMAFCFKSLIKRHLSKGISFSSQRALAKLLILATGIFLAWSLNKFLIFF